MSGGAFTRLQSATAPLDVTKERKHCCFQHKRREQVITSHFGVLLNMLLMKFQISFRSVLRNCSHLSMSVFFCPTWNRYLSNVSKSFARPDYNRNEKSVLCYRMKKCVLL